MRWLAAVAWLIAIPAVAMTPEDCKRIQTTVAKSVVAVSEIRLAPSVTEDGWCRVIDGPLGSGLEWRLETSGSDFTFDLRHDRFEFQSLGPLALTGQVQMQSKRLTVGPFRFIENADNSAMISAAFGNGDAGGAQTMALTGGALSVRGNGGLIDDILAWAFRQDLNAARSSFIAARDQRDYMLDWLNEEALKLVDSNSATAFRQIVRAYPRAHGTAVLAVRDDQPVELDGLISALLFGDDFSRSEAAALIEEAGLRLSWTPG